MKVKVGNKIYTSYEFPIMIILTEADKKNIANMAPTANTYAEFDDILIWTQEEKEKWMEEIEENEHSHHRWLQPPW